MKKRIFALCASIITASLCCVTASADTVDKLIVQDHVSEGETFSVTVEIDSDTNIGYMQSSLEYDDSVIRFVEGEAIGGGGLITVQTYPTTSPDKISCVLTFKAVGTGPAELKLTNGYVFGADGTVLCENSASAEVQVDVSETEAPAETSAPPETSAESSSSADSSSKQEEIESSDTDESSKAQTTKTTEQTAAPEIVNQGYLTELTCDAGKLIPDFAYNIYEYTVYADNSTETAELQATAAAFSDTIEYSEGGKLEIGDNIRTITVTTEDERQKVYTVNIIRAEPESSDTENKTDSRRSDTPGTIDRDKYKDLLNPALAIVLVTLVVALAIVLMWIRSITSKKKKKRR